jgi:hypothetical protein
MPRAAQNQAVGIIIQRSANDLDPLVFDATLESLHSRTAEITSVPVENDADVTEHRNRGPVGYRFRAFFIREDPNPIRANQRARAANGSAPDQLASARDNGPPPTPARPFELYESLLELDKTDAVVTVYTDLEVLESVMFETIDSRNVKAGAAIEVSGVMRQVRFASVSLEPLPTPAVRATKPKKNKGTKSGKKVTNEEQKRRSLGAFLSDTAANAAKSLF